MNARLTRSNPLRGRVREGWGWLLFGAAVVLATSPVWRQLAFGFSPTLDQLLQIVCLPRSSLP